MQDRAFSRRQLGQLDGALDDYTTALAIAPSVLAEQQRADVAQLLEQEQKTAPSPANAVRPRLCTKVRSPEQRAAVEKLTPQLAQLGVDISVEH